MGTVEGEFVVILPLPQSSAVSGGCATQTPQPPGQARAGPAVRPGVQFSVRKIPHTSGLQQLPPRPAVGHL